MKEEQEREKTEDKQMEKKPMYVLKEEMFVGKSIYESYNHYHHTVSKNSKEEYFRLCRTIEFGKELLPSPSEVEETDKKNIVALYKSACDILKTEILKKPSQRFGWGDPASKTFPIYTMSADDGGSISCLQEQYIDAVSFFVETQYAQHIAGLRNIDNQIFYFLSTYEVISKKPSIDDMMDELFKEELMSDITAGKTASKMKKEAKPDGIKS